MKKILFLMVSMFFSMFFSWVCFAEVETVKVSWYQPVACLESCVKALENRFLRIPGVESAEMNQADGIATLKWKPNVPFSFLPINYALRYIGVREQNVWVKARGTISIQGDTYALISQGDGTRFVLLNRVPVNNTNYSNQYNTQNRGLSDEQKQKLTAAAKQKSSVTIEGLLFMPERSPPDPLQLIIGSLQIEESKPAKR